MASHVIKSEVGSLKRALREEEYEASRSIVERINDQVRLVERDFHQLAPKEQFLMRKSIECARSNLSELRQELHWVEDGLRPNFSGAYAAVVKGEIAKLIMETADCIEHIVDNRVGCWISLDEGPLHLI